MTQSIDYIAGLFDGEGYITVDFYRRETHRFTRCQIKAGVSLCHRPTIEALQELFGGIININNSANKKNKNHRIVFAWVLSGRNACEFLEIISPVLILKKRQALCAIELQRHVTEHAYNMRHKKYPEQKREDILLWRERMVAKIRDLKKDAYS